MFSPICDDDLRGFRFQSPKSRTHPNRSITHWYQFPTEIDDGWWFAEIRHEAVPGLWSCDGNIPWFVKETSFMDPKKSSTQPAAINFMKKHLDLSGLPGFPWQGRRWLCTLDQTVITWATSILSRRARSLHRSLHRNPGCKSTRTASWICWAAWNSRWWQAIRSECWPRVGKFTKMSGRYPWVDWHRCGKSKINHL